MTFVYCTSANTYTNVHMLQFLLLEDKMFNYQSQWEGKKKKKQDAPQDVKMEFHPNLAESRVFVGLFWEEKIAGQLSLQQKFVCFCSTCVSQQRVLLDCQ